MVLNVVRYLAEPIRIYHARKLICLSGCVFHIFGLQNLQRHCQEKKFLQCYRFRFPSPTIKLLRLLKNRFLLDFLVHHSEGLTLKHLTNMIFWGMTNFNRVKCARSNSHRTWLINSIHPLLNKGFSDKWSTLVVTNKISLSLSLAICIRNSTILKSNQFERKWNFKAKV